jgi:hypothetical protein
MRERERKKGRRKCSDSETASAKHTERKKAITEARIHILGCPPSTSKAA